MADLDKNKLETLEDWIGKDVRVCIVEDGFSRNHFGPQIALRGILEENDGHYRVLVNDDIFTYFTPENVVLCNPLASVPTITLRIDVQE